jgi:hypothetical protein
MGNCSQTGPRKGKRRSLRNRVSVGSFEFLVGLGQVTRRRLAMALQLGTTSPKT